VGVEVSVPHALMLGELESVCCALGVPGGAPSPPAPAVVLGVPVGDTLGVVETLALPVPAALCVKSGDQDGEGEALGGLEGESVEEGDTEAWAEPENTAEAVPGSTPPPPPPPPPPATCPGE